MATTHLLPEPPSTRICVFSSHLQKHARDRSFIVIKSRPRLVESMVERSWLKMGVRPILAMIHESLSLSIMVRSKSKITAAAAVAYIVSVTAAFCYLCPVNFSSSLLYMTRKAEGMEEKNLNEK